MDHVVIIGNGVAGITAARHIRKLSDRPITVISAETDHFFSRTALMYIYMGQLTYQGTKPYEDDFWPRNRIALARGRVERIDTERRRLLLDDGSEIEYGSLIIATGSRPNTFDWPGETLKGVQGLYSIQDLESMERWTAGIARAVVVGGGLIGIEMAEMLHSRGIAVTFLVRERNYWDTVLPPEEARMVGRHVREHGIDLRTETELREILPDADGRARAVVTTRGEEIPCGFVGLTVGVSPNIGVMNGSGIECNRGVLVDEYFRTGIPGIYAIGDCAEFRDPRADHPAIEQLWYTAKMHGEIVARTICGIPARYARGTWFNSAKFFDIEYQTYGFVWSRLRETEETLYWEHPDGRKSIRINYSKADGRVLGMNLLGIRYRQDVCRKWVEEGTGIGTVLEHLSDANFDPEFHRRYEAEVIKLHNERNPGNAIVLKRKGMLARFFS
ncbi:MAG: FAD-dependent oxidoreductase [Candidatus Kapaibacterium sp.]